MLLPYYIISWFAVATASDFLEGKEIVNTCTPLQIEKRKPETRPTLNVKFEKGFDAVRTYSMRETYRVLTVFNTTDPVMKVFVVISSPQMLRRSDLPQVASPDLDIRSFSNCTLGEHELESSAVQLESETAVLRITLTPPASLFALSLYYLKITMVVQTKSGDILYGEDTTIVTRNSQYKFNCDSMEPISGTGKQWSPYDAVPSYYLSLSAYTYKPGDRLNVTIYSHSVLTPFSGFIVVCAPYTNGLDPREAVGTWYRPGYTTRISPSGEEVSVATVPALPVCRWPAAQERDAALQYTLVTLTYEPPSDAKQLSCVATVVSNDSSYTTFVYPTKLLMNVASTTTLPPLLTTERWRPIWDCETLLPLNANRDEVTYIDMDSWTPNDQFALFANPEIFSAEGSINLTLYATDALKPFQTFIITCAAQILGDFDSRWAEGRLLELRQSGHAPEAEVSRCATASMEQARDIDKQSVKLSWVAPAVPGSDTVKCRAMLMTAEKKLYQLTTKVLTFRPAPQVITTTPAPTTTSSLLSENEKLWKGYWEQSVGWDCRRALHYCRFGGDSRASCDRMTGKCVCSDTVTGFDCSIKKLDVSLDDCGCQHFGVCALHDITGDMTCRCPYNYVGKDCSTDRVSVTCSNSDIEIAFHPYVTPAQLPFYGRAMSVHHSNHSLAVCEFTAESESRMLLRIQRGACGSWQDGDEWRVSFLAQYDPVLFSAYDAMYTATCDTDYFKGVNISSRVKLNEAAPLESWEGTDDSDLVDFTLSTADKNSVKVGDLISLKFRSKVPSQFPVLRVQSCTVSNGEDAEMNLIEDGCPLEDAWRHLVGLPKTDISTATVSIQVRAFDFATGPDNLHFDCRVRLCSEKQQHHCEIPSSCSAPFLRGLSQSRHRRDT